MGKGDVVVPLEPEEADDDPEVLPVVAVPAPEFRKDYLELE